MPKKDKGKRRADVEDPPEQDLPPSDAPDLQDDDASLGSDKPGPGEPMDDRSDEGEDASAIVPMDGVVATSEPDPLDAMLDVNDDDDEDMLSDDKQEAPSEPQVDDDIEEDQNQPSSPSVRAKQQLDGKRAVRPATRQQTAASAGRANGPAQAQDSTRTNGKAPAQVGNTAAGPSRRRQRQPMSPATAILKPPAKRGRPPTPRKAPARKPTTPRRTGSRTRSATGETRQPTTSTNRPGPPEPSLVDAEGAVQPASRQRRVSFSDTVQYEREFPLPRPAVQPGKGFEPRAPSGPVVDDYFEFDENTNKITVSKSTFEKMLEDGLERKWKQQKDTAQTASECGSSFPFLDTTGGPHTTGADQYHTACAHVPRHTTLHHGVVHVPPMTPRTIP
ncbi:hypothetical protein MVEN_02270800 [Mycena venus]|uniref:Uncharacterized protein n=1 Tax=Mycena venus TaxID=2733690 RepID=A0A8H6X5C2_9AGAR|nr:hypothetical protein MVEN_02270800 [Mycena venus]